MKAWMLDIKNEAQNMTFTDEDLMDWWNALFGDIQTIEPKTNAPRRDGLLNDNDNDDNNNNNNHKNSHNSPKPSVDERSPITDHNLAVSTASQLFVQVPPGDFKGYTENEGFSDDDSDDDTTPKGTSMIKQDSIGGDTKRKSQPSNAVVSTPSALTKYSKKIKPVRNRPHIYYNLFVWTFLTIIFFPFC
jgi:hypothetical protein